MHAATLSERPPLPFAGTARPLLCWTYIQSTGALFDPFGHREATGYSGRKGVWRNNPFYEQAKGYGPIPRGDYMIARPRTSAIVGPIAMDLEPVGHNAWGRTALMIHGDNKGGDASRGCIVLDRWTRLQISGSDVRRLVVR